MNSSGPLQISAVIPAYNCAAFISTAIESALAQTYPLVEIIVVDDGSRDETATIAARYPKTRVIRTENRGQGAARNTAIAASRGEWIAFLDADDAWAAEKTAEQARQIASDVGVLHCNRYEVVTFQTLWERKARVTPSGALARKQAITEVGGFDEAREIQSVEDLNLWQRIALKTQWRFVRCRDGLYHRNYHANQESANETKMLRAELANIEAVGALAGRPRSEIDLLKDSVRIEYARNLIATDHAREARELLSACSPSLASRWLGLSISTGVKRLARRDVVEWLWGLQGGIPGHNRSVR